MLILGVAFYVVATSLVSLVGNYLFQERTSQESAVVQRLAIEVAEPFARGDAGRLYQLARDASKSGARVILLDMDAKVQVDSGAEYNGMRFGHPEVVSILEGASEDYGFHRITAEDGASKNWAGYFTAAIVLGEAKLGLVLYSVKVQSMVDEMRSIQNQMLVYFLAVAFAVFCATLIFTQVITKPVAALTEGIKRMAHGDLSTRVKASGIDEMGRLAETFNQMSEKLENMDAIRNEFVSNASHELKTPLATMKIMLESMLYQQDMPVELRTEFLSDINKELDRLSGIVTDLLSLVQTDAHDYRLIPEHFMLRELIEDTAHRLEPLAREKGQTLTVRAHVDCPMFADSAKLQQAIYNLCDNAIKYTQEGGQVMVSLRHEGKMAVIEVTDNGPGIPKKDQQHIFDRFYRVDRARARATGGNGLGLAIVHQIVLLHEGNVSVHSEEGKGTKFRVELPAL